MEKLKCPYCGNEDIWIRVEGEFSGAIRGNNPGNIVDLTIEDDAVVDKWNCDDCGKRFEEEEAVKY